VSLEGSAVDARFMPDGQKLVFKVGGSLGSYPLPGELRIADLETRRSEPLTAGFRTIDYDISADGQQVVMEVADQDGKSRLWLARVDRRLPPSRFQTSRASNPASEGKGASSSADRRVRRHLCIEFGPTEHRRAR
jgi:Tol biopolymer transport system component